MLSSDLVTGFMIDYSSYLSHFYKGLTVMLIESWRQGEMKPPSNYWQYCCIAFITELVLRDLCT